MQQSQLDTWLVNFPIPSIAPKFTLKLWREDRASLVAPFKDMVVEYFDEAFEDARKSLRDALADDLCSFDDPTSDPAANYPAFLNRITQQGYLGEALGALAVEHWGAAGYTDWKVPAMLFRFHTVELQHLASVNERVAKGLPFDQDEVTDRRPGRTGDDALAFRMNEEGVITDVLAIEAKCVGSNRNETIAEAHSKLSTTLLKNSGFMELMAILKEYGTDDARKWHRALLALWREGYSTVGRYDCVSYAVGAQPVQRNSWIDPAKRHPDYKLNRQLVAFEFQIPDLEGAVEIIYRGK